MIVGFRRYASLVLSVLSETRRQRLRRQSGGPDRSLRSTRSPAGWRAPIRSCGFAFAQEFLFHAIGAADATARILNDRRLGLDDARVRSVYARVEQREGTQLHHVTVEGLAEWVAWWGAQEASA